MNKHIKVLHVISQRPDSTGSGIYLQAMLRQTADRGYTNYLIAGLQSGSTIQLPGIKDEHCHYVTFSNDDPSQRIPGMSDVMPYPSRRFHDFNDHDREAYLDRFRKIVHYVVTTIQPDIIHSHHLWLLSSLIKTLFPDVPLVTSCHGSDLRQFDLCPHLRKEVIKGCSHIDVVLALSTEMKREILLRFPLLEERVSNVGAGYSHETFYHHYCHDNTEEIPILYAGKISRAKGIPWLFEAIKRVDAAPVILHLAGTGWGYEYEQLRKYGKKLEIDLRNHGMVNQVELARLMRDSKIFVLPSLHEGLPLVILEALACNCIVIATDLPGTREIKRRLKTNRLLLISTPIVLDTEKSLIEDEKRFVDSLHRALEDTISIAQSQECTDLDLSYFTWPAVFNRIEQQYRKLLAEKSEGN